MRLVQSVNDFKPPPPIKKQNKQTTKKKPYQFTGSQIWKAFSVDQQNPFKKNVSLIYIYKQQIHMGYFVLFKYIL